MVKSALITGAAQRIGSEIARHLHAQGWNLVLHYRTSKVQAEQLSQLLNNTRPDSVRLVQGDISDPACIEQARANWFKEDQKLDLLINNAAVFSASPLNKIDLDHWDTTINTNVRAPLFLCQALAPLLKNTTGSIINIGDVYGQQPLKHYTVYSISKAGLMMMTQSLALELAPHIRVNAIAPGAILYPSNRLSDDDALVDSMLKKVPLNRTGSASDIAMTVLYLATNNYVTGQVIAVDGGRLIS
jgi:pteridine reductase